MRDFTDLHPGRKALQHAMRALEQKPKKDDNQLSFLTQCLADFREELIEVQRKTTANSEDRRRLACLNGIITVVMGMHFPLGNPPWSEFEKACGWLKDLVAQVEVEEATR